MLFANRVILVEGLAEKLLMPLFMEICNCSYEDEYISIVEIGGKHFEHFVELFNGNNVHKKVLCITDRDFKWIDKDGKLNSLADYSSEVPSHISKLNARFVIDNFCITTQKEGGKTFEDEFFLSNIETGISTDFFKKVLCENLFDFFEKHGFNLSAWQTHIEEIDGRSKKVIEKYITAFNDRKDSSEENKAFYENLIFAELFLHYARDRKGDIALQILSDENLVNEVHGTKIKVPAYIQEGLEWLLK